MKKKLKKISSIGNLQSKCDDSNPLCEEYRKLAISASRNLGGNPADDWRKSIQWLIVNANETSEEGVVDEINFLR